MDEARGPREHHLVDEARARRPARPSRREWLGAGAGAASFVAAASAFTLLAPSSRPFGLGAFCAFAAAFALLSNVWVETASGSAVPTQLVFVPMLFTLPLPLVPWCVCLGYVAGGLVAGARGHAHHLRAWALVGCSWFSLGPAVLLAAAGGDGPAWRSWPVYLGAFAAQCAADLAHSSFHEAVAHAIPPRTLLRPLAGVYVFDALLSPVAFLAALEPGGVPAVGALLPLALVFVLLARERRVRMDAELHAVELESLAHEDALTGLGNRRRLDADLARACAEPGDDGWLLALFDLDGFKRYNDTYGHLAGDALLAGLGRSLGAVAGPRAYRLGGDEFCVLVPAPAGALLRECARALSEVEARCPILASSGVARIPDEAATPSDALRLADRRLYGEKGRRRGSAPAAPRAAATSR